MTDQKTKTETKAVEIDEAKLDKATAGARKAGGTQQEYVKIELENVQITSYQLGTL